MIQHFLQSTMLQKLGRLGAIVDFDPKEFIVAIIDVSI